MAQGQLKIFSFPFLDLLEDMCRETENEVTPLRVDYGYSTVPYPFSSWNFERGMFFKGPGSGFELQRP